MQTEMDKLQHNFQLKNEGHACSTSHRKKCEQYSSHCAHGDIECGSDLNGDLNVRGESFNG